MRFTVVPTLLAATVVLAAGVGVSPNPVQPLLAACQADFGVCDAAVTAERCGPDHGHQQCSDNQCCSSEGYCGTEISHCKVPQSCQRLYGHCDSDITPSGPSTKSDRRPKLSKHIPYGTLIDRCTQKGTVALTYDDGPSNNTFDLLRILAEANAKATFFLSGITNGKGELDKTPKWIRLIQNITAQGHQVASHSWSHLNMDAITSKERRKEMYKIERVIANILGKYPTFMRPPYVNCSRDTGCLMDMKDLGYHVIGYQIDSNDWKYPDNLDAMKASVDKALKDASFNSGLLLVQHDTIALSAIDLTRYILHRVKDLGGLKFVTVSECLGEAADVAYRANHVEAHVHIDDAHRRPMPFTDRRQCFASVQDCYRRADVCWAETWHATPLDQWFLYCTKFSQLCNKLLLFCAQCDHGEYACNSKGLPKSDFPE